MYELIDYIFLDNIKKGTYMSLKKPTDDNW